MENEGLYRDINNLGAVLCNVESIARNRAMAYAESSMHLLQTGDSEGAAKAAILGAECLAKCQLSGQIADMLAVICSDHGIPLPSEMPAPTGNLESVDFSVPDTLPDDWNL